MIFLDATGLLALLLGEPGAADVEELLREGDVHVTAVNYAEVVDQATRVQGKGLRDLDLAVQPLTTHGILTISDVTAAVGLRAGGARSRHYDRQRCPVSLADCILLGAASIERSEVATSDQSLANAARAEQLTVRALRNSGGVRPTLDA